MHFPAMSSSWSPSEASDWVGCALDQNARDKMEDVVDVTLIPGGGIFTVLDGHNGRVAVDFVARHLPASIMGSVHFEEGQIEEALISGFRETECGLVNFLIQQQGAAAACEDADFPHLTSGVVVCVLVLLDNHIYTAHVGDCRAVLSRNFQALPLTVDHNVGNVDEKDRVSSLVSPEGYINGLMVTRSLGNVSCHTLEKCEGQIAVPTCSHFPISFDTDEFVLIASDGLYEVFSNDAIISIVRRAMIRPSFSPDKAARELVERAIMRGSCDNVCVCLIFLKQRTSPAIGPFR